MTGFFYFVLLNDIGKSMGLINLRFLFNHMGGKKNAPPALIIFKLLTTDNDAWRAWRTCMPRGGPGTDTYRYSCIGNLISFASYDDMIWYDMMIICSFVLRQLREWIAWLVCEHNPMYSMKAVSHALPTSHHAIGTAAISNEGSCRLVPQRSTPPW